MLLCLGAQRPLGRTGWCALPLHRGSDGRALSGSARQWQEGRARATRNARPLALLPRAQGGEDMVEMVLQLRRYRLLQRLLEFGCYFLLIRCNVLIQVVFMYNLSTPI